MRLAPFPFAIRFVARCFSSPFRHPGATEPLNKSRLIFRPATGTDPGRPRSVTRGQSHARAPSPLPPSLDVQQAHGSLPRYVPRVRGLAAVLMPCRPKTDQASWDRRTPAAPGSDRAGRRGRGPCARRGMSAGKGDTIRQDTCYKLVTRVASRSHHSRSGARQLWFRPVDGQDRHPSRCAAVRSTDGYGDATRAP